MGTVLLSSILALAVQGLPLAAQDTEGAKVVSVVQLSATEQMGTIEGLPGHQARGPILTQAPPPPRRDLEETEEKQPTVPVIDDGLDIPPQQKVATRGAALSETRAPGTFVILRDSSMAPAGLTSNVAEPNVGSQADGIFNTHNWYAEVSTNNGTSFSFVSPFSTFPSSPSAFSAGFCCDQRVAQDSSRDLIFWYLQYIKTGSTSSSTNGVRVAVTHGQSGLAANSWTYYNFTPALFGLPAGTWLDFPHLQASANYLYFTTNIFNAASDTFYGAMIVRMPLSQLDSGSALTLNYFTVVGSYGSIMAVPGAEASGTRPGRTTMYFGSLFSSTSIKVITWPESTTTLTISTVSGLATTYFSGYACPGPDGLDPCTRADGRMQTGWITDTELGLMWGSSQNGSSRPYPFTRAVILNPSTLAVLSQPDIYNTSAAWLYPSMSVNERGHLGGTADYMGGTVYPTIAGIIRDDFSPDPFTSGWEAYVIDVSNSGTFGRWGDYNGSLAHEKYPKTWLAAGHVQAGGSGNGNSVVHNYWFARERDSPIAPQPCYTLTRTHTGSGGDPAAASGSSAGCPSGQYHAAETITLSASPSPGWTVASWSGTNNNASTSTSNTATMPAGNLTVGVNYAAIPDVGLSNGVPYSDSVTSGTVQGAWKYYYVDLGPGSSNLQVTLSALSADADLYVRYNAKPTLGTYDCRPFFGSTSTEQCTFSTPTAGRWWIGVNNFDTGTITYQVMASWTGGPGLKFYTVTPCRLMDTRSGSPASSGTRYWRQVTGFCGIPAAAAAVAANVTVVGSTGSGYVTLWPGDLAQPGTSTINFGQGQVRANNALLTLATDGVGDISYAASVNGNGSVHLIIDLSGYFAP